MNQAKNQTKKQPLTHSGSQYLFETDRHSDVLKPTWQRALSDYARNIKRIMGDGIQFSCQAYRKDGLNCMTVTFVSEQTQCDIHLVESERTSFPELSQRVTMNSDSSYHSTWLTTWYLIDGTDMFYVACHIAELLEAELTQDKKEHQIELLMIQRAQNSKINALFKEFN